MALGSLMCWVACGPRSWISAFMFLQAAELSEPPLQPAVESNTPPTTTAPRARVTVLRIGISFIAGESDDPRPRRCIPHSYCYQRLEPGDLSRYMDGWTSSSGWTVVEVG